MKKIDSNLSVEVEKLRNAMVKAYAKGEVSKALELSCQLDQLILKIQKIS